jgi:outer membrane protein
MKKLGFFLGICCLVWLINTPLQAGEIKIAIVDMQKALNLSEAGKTAKAKLGEKFAKIKKDLGERQQEIEKLKKELEKQSLMLSLEAKRDKEKEYERKLRDFKDLYQDYKEEMNKAEYEAIQPIFHDIQQVAEEIRKKEGYSIIFDKNSSGVVCYKKEIDITDTVIKLYNKEMKGKQKKIK